MMELPEIIKLSNRMKEEIGGDVKRYIDALEEKLGFLFILSPKNMAYASTMSVIQQLMEDGKLILVRRGKDGGDIGTGLGTGDKEDSPGGSKR